MAEEIEEDSVIDSWESFEENPDILDKQLKKMALSSNQTNMNRYSDTVIVNEEEALRSSTFNAQEPKIMILRRPQPSVDEVPNGNIINKQKNPVKTLEQRQADYAQARLRILGNSGSVSSPEDHKYRNYHKSTDQESDNSAHQENDPDHRLEDLTLGSKMKHTGGFVRSSVNVVRTPRGPSNSAGGFQNRGRNKEPS